MTNIVAHWYSHDFHEGLKLMEHSWAGGQMVTNVVRWLYENPHRLVWAGDYADEEPDGETLYNLADGSKKGGIIGTAAPRFLVNHTKRQYVDLADCPAAAYYHSTPSIIHPLPLLVSEGNGRGGGDFHKSGSGLGAVGMWARDVISTSNSFPAGMVELRPDFLEEGAVIVPMAREQVLAQFYTPVAL